MKTLTLLRHAKSDWAKSDWAKSDWTRSGRDDPALRDFDRPLNAKGRRAAVTVGRHLRDEGLAFDHVVASPAVRVMETIDAVGQGLGRRLAPEWDRRLYLASADELVAVVRALPDAATRVLLVGHNPGIEELVLMLVPVDAGPLRDAVAAKYPTASVAEMTLADGWAGAEAGAATLARFVRPRDLDASLGPDED